MERCTSIKDTYKATAHVGGDTIEDAEYFLFEYTKIDKEKTFKDKMEDLWWNITIPFYRIKRWFKDTYWEVRYGFQRMFNGYDSVDVFETYYKFVERYEKILTRYKKNHRGYPGTMNNEEWENIIDEMLYHLHYMVEENVERELEKDVPECWHASLRTAFDIMEKHKDEFFKLFSKYFYNLWD